MCAPWPQGFIPLKATQVRIYCKKSMWEETQKPLAALLRNLFMDHRLFGSLLPPPKMFASQGGGSVYMCF